MEENKEIKEEEIKEETKEEVKEEKKKGSPVVGVILICVCLIVGVICFYLGTMFAKKEQVTTTTTTKEASTTTTESTTVSTTTTTTTTKAISKKLKANKANKNYEKDDKPNTKNYGYKYEDYSIEYNSSNDIEKAYIGNILIEDLIGVPAFIERIHRYKYFLLIEFTNGTDAGPYTYYDIYDYEGNLLLNTEDKIVLTDGSIINEEDFEYGKGKWQLFFDSLSYNPKNGTITLHYGYSEFIKPVFVDEEEETYDEDEIIEEDEEDEEDSVKPDAQRNECENYSQYGGYYEVYTTISVKDGIFGEMKFIKGTKASEVKELVNFCKNEYGFDIK